MYIVNFKRNMPLFLILRPISKNTYSIEECFHCFDTAYLYLRMYGNTKCIILKVILKEVVN